MNFLVKDRSFYKSLAAIALPIALQNAIGFGVGMMDTIMVGALGDTALSGASLANQPFFVFMVFNFGLASGGAVLIAQYWGRENVDAVRRIMGISVRFITIAAILFSLVCNLFPNEILRIFSKDPGVIEAGASYLRMVSFSYLFYGIASCYLTSLRAVEMVKMSTLVYGISFFVNVFFNWVFIFGKLGAPALGIVGAAVGTLIARVSEFLMVLVYILFIEKKVQFKLKYIFQQQKELLPDYFRHSLPVVGSELVWSLGAVTQAAIIGNISATFVAANSIAGVMQQLATVMLFGLANAAAVMVGKSVGAGKYEDTNRISKTLLILGVGVGLFSCGLILVLRGPFLTLYDVQPATKELAYSIMGVLACVMAPAAIEILSIIGILRGGGDTRFAFLVDCGCTWLLGVPMGYLAGFVWKLPVLLVFICLRCDVPVRLALCLTRILREKYIRNVTRDIQFDS